MKKLGRITILTLLLIVLSTLLFVACNTNESDNNQTPNDNRQTDVNEDQKPQYVVTVHPNNGNNSFEWTINSEIPLIEREGYYFDGIYLDSMFKSATSFESLKKAGIVSDIDVYVKWTAHKHEFGSWYILIPPTHVSEGLRVWYCSLCDAEKYEDMQKIGEHRFSDVWTIDIDSTETSEGEKSHHCVISGCTERKDVTSIPKKEAPQPDTPIEHTHSMILVKRVPATCTVTGYEISKCEGCDYTSRITLPIVANDLGHSHLLAGEKCDKCGYVSISNLQNSVLMYNTEYDTYCAEYYGTSTQKDVFKFYNQRINLAYLQNTVETIESDSFKDWISLDHIIIPNSVAKIESNAFYGCASLKEISIPNNVEEIEEAAFSQCVNLETVNMSQSLKRLGKNVLYGTKWFEKQPVGQLYLGNAAIANKQDCSKVDAIKEGTRIVADEFFAGQSELSIITIPSSIQFFGTKVFDGCSNLTGVYYNAINAECSDSLFDNMTSIEHTVFGRDVEKIPDLLFANCSSLADVMFSGNTVTEIGVSAFSECSKLSEIIVPNSVESIGENAFFGCSSLESITIPFVGAKAGVTSGDTYQYPFGYIFGTSSYDGGVATTQRYCGNSTSSTTSSTYYIPSSLKAVTVTSGDILYGAFYNCSGLTSITIPDSVMSIGDYAFFGCNGLTSVTIPDGMTSIGDYAFAYCSGLTSITIPDSVTNIDEYAFLYCNNIVDIYVADIVSWCNISGLYNLMDYGSQNIKLFLNNELITAFTIPNGVTSIPDYAFKNCTNLTSVTIPNNVMSIGKAAFYNCTCLTSVTIGNGVTSIGDNAFNNCSGLTSVTITDSVASIGNYAFSDCSGLISIKIPDSVTSIGSSAFSGCSSLESITIPFVGAKAGVTSSDTYQYPFGYIFGTSSYDGGVATTQHYCYYGNGTSSTTSSTYYIPSSLKSVTVTGGNILYGAFYNCNSLTSVAIPDNVTSIGVCAFYGCSGLTSITIPDSVTSIGESAFYYRSGLTTVFYAGTENQWETISIGSYNSSLTSATRYYYSETEPPLNADGTEYDGNYWHYDTDGVTIILWKKLN